MVSAGAGLWIIQNIFVLLVLLVLLRIVLLPADATLASAWVLAGLGSLVIAFGLNAFRAGMSDMQPTSGEYVVQNGVADETRRKAQIAFVALLLLAVVYFGIAGAIVGIANPLLNPVRAAAVVIAWLFSATVLVTACFTYSSFVRGLTLQTSSLDFPRARGLRGYSVLNLVAVSFYVVALLATSARGAFVLGVSGFFLEIFIVPIAGIIVSAWLLGDGRRLREVRPIQALEAPATYVAALAAPTAPMPVAGGWSFQVTAERPTAVHQRVQAAVVSQGFWITANDPPQRLTAHGTRSYSVGILVLLIFLFLPAAAVYYFTRKRNTVTVAIQDTRSGSYVDISAEGKEADEILRSVVAGLAPRGPA